ncbi:MAG: hypothetical protein R6V12_16425 [Candidatus Hydrogenedentota bacterium]
MRILWTDYLRYRAKLRGFELARIEEVVRYSMERYVDNATGRLVAIGKDAQRWVMVPYEMEEDIIRPVTVHTTTRKQIKARISSGRFTHE